MCCVICSSRGIAYFGVTIHLLTGLLILPLISLTAAYSIGPYGSGRDLSKFDTAFMAVYTVGILILSFVIFRGVKDESLLLLKLSTAFMFVFQTVSLVITMSSWKTIAGNELSNVVRIVSIFLNGLATVVYITVLILFMRHVHMKQNGELDIPDDDSYRRY